MLANRFFTLLKGSFDTSWEAKESDPETERKTKNNENVCGMKFLSAVHNTGLHLKASVSFCMHLLHMISENSDTDCFHLIRHCKLINHNNYKIMYISQKKQQQQQTKNKGNSIQLLLKLHV